MCESKLFSIKFAAFSTTEGIGGALFPGATKKRKHEEPVHASSSFVMEKSKEDLVGEWLDELGMSQYKQVFRDAGVYDLEAVLKLNPQSLSETLGIQRKDHKNKLALGIKKLSKGVNTQSTFSQL